MFFFTIHQQIGTLELQAIIFHCPGWYKFQIKL